MICKCVYCQSLEIERLYKGSKTEEKIRLVLFYTCDSTVVVKAKTEMTRMVAVIEMRTISD
jgi:hypothetical protein